MGTQFPSTTPSGSTAPTGTPPDPLIAPWFRAFQRDQDAANAKQEDFFSALAEIFRAQSSASLASSGAANALAREQLELQREALAEEMRQFGLEFGEEGRQFDLTFGEQARQFGLTFAEQQAARAFQEKDVITGRLFESSALATGPTGAIQLAHLARGQGAPQADVAAIFQNLPFVQALLRGEALPGFGLPEQLGGTMTRVPGVGTGNVIEGKNLGVTLPSKTGVTEQQWTGMSAFEQMFLGALGQSETGQDAAGFLADIQKSFIPTTTAFSF